MAQILRQLLVAIALLFLAALILLKLSDVVMCGGLRRICPGTLQWILVDWIGQHQVVALGAVGAYVVALLALYGREVPQTVAESVKPHFVSRALVYIAVACVVFVLATDFPSITSLLSWEN